jgi:protein TonB
VPGGVVGGVVGGVIGGVLGGVPGGVLGGLPGEDQPIYLTGDVRAPERTTFIKPDYPEVARKARAEGKVILEIVVGRTGEVEQVKLLKSNPLFDQAAIEAVKKWKYTPALQSGRPVKVYLTVIVDFNLK